MRSDPPALDIRPQPSICLLTVLLGVHAAAAVAVPLTGFDAVYQWLMAGAVLMSLVFSLRRHYFGIAGSRIVWLGDGTWSHTDPRGTATSRISRWEAAWVSPQLLLIRLKPDRRRRWITLVLCGDAVPPELLRALRVRLYLFRDRCDCRESES